MEKLYVFTNWGDRVYVPKEPTNELELGVITEISENKEEVKVTYQSGGFNWFNRDELEVSLKAKETVAIDTEI